MGESSSRFEEPVDRVDDDIRDSKASLAELLGRVSGNRGAYYLVDRNSGHTMAVTFWETEEALRASEEEAARIRAESSDRAGAKILTVEHYEVAIRPSDVLVKPH